MPELPEVETTRRGIAPHITGQRVTRVIVRKSRGQVIAEAAEDFGRNVAETIRQAVNGGAT